MTTFDLSWHLDPASVLLLALVLGIALAVLPFAHRSLRGDRQGAGVTIAIAGMLAATALLVVSGELWMFALAWSAATAATLTALGLGGGVRALRRATPWLVGGDIALWSAVALHLSGTAGHAPALLMVIAAVVRCALPPAHSWLVDSLYAPTPVSAALHGGIVNGGGILIITQFEIIASSPAAIGLLATLSAGAIVIGALVALVRTDVKGRLVASTVAQMGFMLLVASLGLITAALLHLVAHGFYKSALFLSSSDGIDRRAQERRAPRPTLISATERHVRAVAGALVPVISLVVVAVAIYPGGRGLAELLLLLAISVAFAAAGGRAAVLAGSRRRAAAFASALAGGAAVFAAATSALTATVSLARPADVAAQPFALSLAVLVVIVLASMAIVRRWGVKSPAALALLALGHRWGAEKAASPRGSRLRTRSAPLRLVTPLHTRSAPKGATA